MIIDCIADLHGWKPTLEGGDLLIIAGDLTSNHSLHELDDFNDWVRDQPYDKKILIGGNHDIFLEDGVYDPFDVATHKDECVIIDPSVDYLFDSGTEYKGLKIWGCPWTPWFIGVNPKCKAFMKSDSKLSEYWEKIPMKIDILITHGPAYGVLDGIPQEDGTLYHAGSKSLRDWIEKIMPEMVLFGHIHEQGGQYVKKEGILYINGSVVDERYRHVNKRRRIFFDEKMPKMQRFEVIE
jgi:Icc-related predicted phosphoesterase